MSKRTTNLTPPRKPRGSIRKAKRAEMRKQKMVNLAIAQAEAQVASQATAQVEEQTEARTVLQVRTKVKAGVEAPEKPKGHILRRAVHNSIRLVSRKALTAEEPHELSVELSGGKTIS